MSRGIASGVWRMILPLSALTAVAAACADAHSAKSELAATTVVVWPDTVTINEGDTLRLRALFRASDRNILAGQNITWTIGDSSIARVLDGLVTGGRAGSTTITATAAGTRGSAYVEVVK